MHYASQAQAKYTPDSEGESGVRTALRGIHLENMQKQNQLTGNTAMSRTVLIAPHLPVRLEVILASAECSASSGRSKVSYATGDSLAGFTLSPQALRKPCEPEGHRWEEV